MLEIYLRLEGPKEREREKERERDCSYLRRVGVNVHGISPEKAVGWDPEPRWGGELSM